MRALGSTFSTLKDRQEEKEAKRATSESLAQRIGRVEEQSYRDLRAGVWATGVPEIDSALPGQGLTRAGVHEWCSGQTQGVSGSPGPRGWMPSLSLAAHLVGEMSRQGASAIVWVGARVWASGAALAGAGVLERSVFVRAGRVHERLWACETLLRCGSAVVVVVDGSGMDLTMTRRLQLAAQANTRGRGLALSLRPGHELREPSAATTRWLVTPQSTEGAWPRWRVELVRCKGPQPMTGAPRRWVVEHKSDGTGVMCVPAQLGDGSGSSAHEGGSWVGGGADPFVTPRRTA